MARRAYSGRLMAEWVGDTRRWHIYSTPGQVFMLALPGSRESVVALMRTMNGLPTGAEQQRWLTGRGKAAAICRSVLGIALPQRATRPRRARHTTARARSKRMVEEPALVAA
mgnify:CR=1 FL=1